MGEPAFLFSFPTPGISSVVSAFSVARFSISPSSTGSTSLKSRTQLSLIRSELGTTPLLLAISPLSCSTRNNATSLNVWSTFSELDSSIQYRSVVSPRMSSSTFPSSSSSESLLFDSSWPFYSVGSSVGRLANSRTNLTRNEELEPPLSKIGQKIFTDLHQQDSDPTYRKRTNYKKDRKRMRFYLRRVDSRKLISSRVRAISVEDPLRGKECWELE